MLVSSNFGRKFISLFRSFLQKPNVVFAIVLQLLLAALVVFFIPILDIHASKIFYFILIQAFVAACVVLLLGWNWWWAVIQFFFPIALSAVLHHELNFTIPLVLCLVLMLVHFGALRNRVPYFPSDKSIFPVLALLLPSEPKASILDMGSGYGGVLRSLRKSRPDLIFWGIELALLPWVLGRAINWFRGAPIHLLFGNLFKLDLSQFDLAYAYLSSAVMTDLGSKVRSEMRPGSIFVSCEFSVEDFSPDLTINYKNAPPLYIWRI